VSVAKRHQEAVVAFAERLSALGYELLATEGTAEKLRDAGIAVEIVKKLKEGHPNLLDFLANEDVQLIMNTPSGKGARTDEGRIRAACVSGDIPCVTTIQGIGAVVLALEALREEDLVVEALQDRLHSGPTQTEAISSA
jgi:carbamoyl-phosphate synthase large subunit